MIIINSNTRQFNVPGADLVFGVSGDSGSEVKRFQCSRYVGNNLDLMSCFVRINFRNGNGKTDSYLVDDMAIDGDNVTFSWLLSPKVTEYRGQIKFVVCAVGPDLKLKWHTTQGTGQVMEGLEPDNSHAESQTADVVAQLISMVEEQTSAVAKVGTEQVAAVKASAKTAQDSAVAEIEAKRHNSLESIPADYTALSATVDAHVREAAPGIVCREEGGLITLNDSSDNHLRGLRIFGKSTQDGTPTPENPVEIVSIENPVISVDEQNISIPRTLPGIPVTSGGNYTDENGQQWICDEVDFKRGVYVQRANVKTFDGTEKWNVSTSPNDKYFSIYHSILGSSVDGQPKSSHFSLLKTGNSGYFFTGSVGFGFYHTSADVNEWKAFLAERYANSTPVELAYVLATPIETPLSETELAAYRALHTNKPNTTIINDSGAYMSVDYTADTKLYIDKKIKEALQ